MDKAFKNKIQLAAKDTIGYSEAISKDSFMIGVSVAISKLEDSYDAEIKTLNDRITMWQTAHENVYKDIKTLCSIIERYSDND